jgi:multiple sugar transport system permease protein
MAGCNNVSDYEESDGKTVLRFMSWDSGATLQPYVNAIQTFEQQNHFVWCWNEFLTPLIFINDQELYTLPLGINLFKNAFNIEYEKLMAVSCLSVLFPLTLFYFTQNLVLGGISLSGVKK